MSAYISGLLLFASVYALAWVHFGLVLSLSGFAQVLRWCKNLNCRLLLTDHSLYIEEVDFLPVCLHKLMQH